MKRFILLLILSAYINETPDCTIVKETWGAFNESDFDKMIQYSVNKEYVLLEKMITEHRIINIKSGTKVILVDAGFTMHVVRPRNSELNIYIIAEHLKC